MNRKRLSAELSDKPCTAFLDELDKLENFDSLYRLNYADVGLVLASTNRSALMKSSGRLLSRLAVKEIRFRSYCSREGPEIKPKLREKMKN